jgi:hypothetical protein
VQMTACAKAHHRSRHRGASKPQLALSTQ